MSFLETVVSVFFFILLSIVFLIGFIVLYPNASQLSIPLVVAGAMVSAALVAFGPAALKATTNRRQATEKLDQLTASIRTYIETLERSRAFAAVEVPGLLWVPKT